MTDRKCTCACANPTSISDGRRSLLAGAAALALSPFASVHAQPNPRMARPQPGDVLVFGDGSTKGEAIKVADIAIGDHPRAAYPMDATSRTVRDGSRVNLLLLVKLKAEDIAEKSRPRAADGVLAYSAVCTHYGCQITVLHANARSVVCNCHGSTFDAGNNGEIVVGPATRRLANLPLKAVDGALVVAAAFTGQLGPPQQ